MGRPLEGKINQGIVAALRRVPGITTFKHADLVTAGVPDISITGRGHTLWIEVKIANPGVSYRELQLVNMERLALGGRAVYVIFEYQKGTYVIVRPCDIKRWPSLESDHIRYETTYELANTLTRMLD